MGINPSQRLPELGITVAGWLGKWFKAWRLTFFIVTDLAALSKNRMASWNLSVNEQSFRSGRECPSPKCHSRGIIGIPSALVNGTRVDVCNLKERSETSQIIMPPLHN
jgi:hypothetical protein